VADLPRYGRGDLVPHLDDAAPTAHCLALTFTPYHLLLWLVCWSGYRNGMAGVWNHRLLLRRTTTTISSGDYPDVVGNTPTFHCTVTTPPSWFRTRAMCWDYLVDGDTGRPHGRDAPPTVWITLPTTEDCAVPRGSISLVLDLDLLCFTYPQDPASLQHLLALPACPCPCNLRAFTTFEVTPACCIHPFHLPRPTYALTWRLPVLTSPTTTPYAVHCLCSFALVLTGFGGGLRLTPGARLGYSTIYGTNGVIACIRPFLLYSDGLLRPLAPAPPPGLHTTALKHAVLYWVYRA